MHTVRITIIAVLALLTLGMGSAPAGPPEGFQYISEWGVYARGDDLFWHAGVQWKLKDGTWVKLEAGNWIRDPHPPTVIVAIPKDKLTARRASPRRAASPRASRRRALLPVTKKRATSFQLSKQFGPLTPPLT